MHQSVRATTARAFLVLLALFAIPLATSAADAAEWWVNPAGGSDSNSGTSSSSAFATIGRAASSASSGDQINLMAGVHSGTISGPAGTIWMGVQSDPSAARNVGLSLSSSNVTVMWMQARSLRVSGTGNTLIEVSMTDTTQSVYWNGDNNRGDRLTIHCFRFHMVGADANFYPVSNWVEDNYIANSTIYCNSTSGTSNVVYLRSGRRNTFHRVRWYVRASQGLNDAQLYNQYNWVSSKFTNCFWDIANLKTTDDNVKLAFNVRDQVANYPSFVAGFTAMEACTIWVRPGNGQRADILLANSGTHPGSVGRNRYDSLLVISQSRNSTYGNGAYWGQARNDTIRWSVFVGENYRPFEIDFAQDSILVEHNTFISLGSRVAAGLATDPYYSGGGPHFLRRNLFYSTQPSNSSGAPLTWNSRHDDERSRESLMYAPNSSSSNAVVDLGSGPSTASAYDGASHWGDPQFAGPMDMASILHWVFTLRQNPFALVEGSAGLNRTGYTPWSDGYVGAFRDPAGGGSGTDVTPPAEVVDLGANGVLGSRE